MSNQTVEVSARVPSHDVSWMQDVFPFVTSLMLHALVVVIGILSYKAYQNVKAPTPLVEQITIPVSNIVENRPPGGVLNPGLHDNPLLQAMQDNTPEGGKGFAEKKGPKIDVSNAGGGSGDSIDAVIAVGPEGGFGHGSGPTSGIGGSSGPSEGERTGDLAMFGPAGGGSRNHVFGPPGEGGNGGGNARTIIFVCDGTGSMMNKLPQLKLELARAVQELKPIQSFNIVFYQDNNVLKLDGNMIPANPANKRKAQAWLEDLIAAGQTDPVPALTFALASKPELMYFLTDAADFPDVPAVQNVFHKLHAQHPTKVNTILFVESKAEQEANKESEPLMAGIARENAGNFRWVTLDDLH
jgi:hypothetical protein